VTFSAPIASGYSLTLKDGTTAIDGTTALSNGAKTLTFTPTSALPLTRTLDVSLSGVVSQDGVTLAARTWSFTTESPTTAVSLFSGLTPASSSVDDSSSGELGTVCSPTAAGTATGVRFYRGPGNDGTHTGTLWDINGNSLATVTFTGETASGWQSALFSTPVALTPGQSYVVSYHAPQGHYAATGAFFTTPYVRGPLTAPASNNGRYLYSGTSSFPTRSFNSANYFVDVIFQPAS